MHVPHQAKLRPGWGKPATPHWACALVHGQLVTLSLMEDELNLLGSRFQVSQEWSQPAKEEDGMSPLCR